MLDETLVLVNAEFGRTPAINKNAGRDHWPWVYSLALAGAGIRAGTVYGASDNSAAYPADKPHDPKDMAATIYHLLGVDPQTVIHDATGRPHQLVSAVRSTAFSLDRYLARSFAARLAQTSSLSLRAKTCLLAKAGCDQQTPPRWGSCRSSARSAWPG